MTHIKALSIPAEGRGQLVDVAADLNAVSRAIGGGYVIKVAGDIWALYADEDGIAKQLPLNALATRLATWLMMARQVALNEPIYLYGTILFCGDDNSGEFADIAQSVLDVHDDLADDL
jgi:hypothetical protein